MREFGSEFPALSSPDNYFDDLTKDFADFAYLRSGRESLGYVAENIASGNKTILIPAYHCESMAKPFTQRGWSVHYYCLNKDLSIDTFCLSQLIKKLNPSTVLTMNFFGITLTDKAILFIKMRWQNIIIIEDFTHCLFSFYRIFNQHVDFYIASIRKWLGVFDGALVLSTKALKYKPKYRSNRFVLLRQKAQQEKANYLGTGDTDSKERFRKALVQAEEILNIYSSINCISPDSMDLLKNVKVADFVFRRRNNLLHLINELSCLSPLLAFFDNIEESALGCPFSLPVLIKNRDMIQKSLASKGLYTQVLWPIGKVARKACSNSVLIADNMLSIPIDQRYDYNDMEDIIKIIKETL
jgi:dTDP-4-amino-4,6-dideoxygalactose transaminase